MDKMFKYGGNWHVRDEAGQPVNLNTGPGARYVLSLQARIRELESRPKRRRTKAGPSENKRERG